MPCGCLPRLALRIVGQHGIWGGLVPADRARLRRLLTGHGWRCGTDVAGSEGVAAMSGVLWRAVEDVDVP